MARRKRSWGSIRKLPSGRYQVRYLGPDLEYRPAPETFTRRGIGDCVTVPYSQSGEARAGGGPATLEELDAITESVPERYRTAVLLGPHR